MNQVDIQQIEQKFPVECIRVNGFAAWPFIRVYLGDALFFDADRRVKVNEISKRAILSSLMWGFFAFFGNYRRIIFSVSSQRRNMNGIMTDRFDYLAEKLGDCLYAESPAPKHFARKTVPTRRIMSKTWFHVAEMLKSKRIKTVWENENILDEIYGFCGVCVEHRSLAKRYFAQYQIMRHLIKRKKLTDLFLITSYTNMGYVKACREAGVRVTEFQHGVINKAHFAYNVSKNIDPMNYPDYLLTWGEFEKQVFAEENFFIDSRRVIAVGHFYLDFINSNLQPDTTLGRVLGRYTKTIAFTAQDAFEEKVLPVIVELAMLKPEWAVVYIPRRKTAADYTGMPENVIFAGHLNCYEVMAQTDIHVTVSSTCALEAPALGKPNVLFDFEGRAGLFYMHVLGNKKHTIFAADAAALVGIIETAKFPDAKSIQQEASDLIRPHFRKNIDEFLKMIQC